jgi:hypothetical protein
LKEKDIIYNSTETVLVRKLQKIKKRYPHFRKINLVLDTNTDTHWLSGVEEVSLTFDTGSFNDSRVLNGCKKITISKTNSFHNKLINIGSFLNLRELENLESRVSIDPI